VAAVLGTTAAPASAGSVTTDARAELAAGIEADVASLPSIPGEILTVRAPGLRISLATGEADRSAGTPLAPETPFRVASMTKTFVAAAVLRLVEEGEVALDDPIARHLSDATVAMLAGDGYDPSAITVRQLLDHTSGLYDYASDPEYQVRTITDPTHRWTRAEQVRFALDHGDPIGAPGTVFAYSDTGYVLLGEVLEQVTGKSLPRAARRLLDFDRLGLHDTWWESLERAPRGEPTRALQYVGDVDNGAIDPSTDLYGGGGLVSTTGDLVRFYDALFSGRVFDDRATLDTMLEVPAVAVADGAGMGIFEVDAAGERCFGHRGFWGTQTIHCPDLDLTFARTINLALAETFDSNPLEATIVAAAKAARAA
jgi:D-alanyl-D-alanine carboxypeptidase